MSQRFTYVHPSGFPLACTSGWITECFGFFPELHTPLLPATHVRVGTGQSNTYPGYVISVTANLLTNAPLTHATSRRTTLRVPSDLGFWSFDNSHHPRSERHSRLSMASQTLVS